MKAKFTTAPAKRIYTCDHTRYQSSYFRPGQEPKWYKDIQEYRANREFIMVNDPNVTTKVSNGIKIETTIVDVYTKLASESKLKYEYSFKSLKQSKLYPCIGGPQHGAKLPLGPAGYIAYNCAVRPNRRNKSTAPSAIQVWAGYFPPTVAI